MALDPRRFDQIEKVVRDTRRGLDDTTATILARLAAHTHPAAGGAAGGSAFVSTDESTTSTTFTDLATVGPAATVTIGASGIALVILSCQKGASASGTGSDMHYAVSGASTVAASGTDPLTFNSTMATDTVVTKAFVNTGLASGSTTFTAKYRNVPATGAYKKRSLVVVAF